MVEDIYLVSPFDIISNPGPISAKDAASIFDITQRPAKQIERQLHPELVKDTAGTDRTGGWSTSRLKV